MNAQTNTEAAAVLDVAGHLVQPGDERDDLLKEVRALTLPKRAELVATADDAKQRVALFVAIESDEDMELATLECQTIKRLWDRLDTQRKSYTGPLNDTVKAINDFYRPALTALADGETTLKRLMGSWEQAKQQREAEARRQAAAAEAAARERLAEEQRRLDAEAAERRQREEAEAAERARRAQEAAAALLERASAAQAAGDPAAAERARREAEETQRRAQEEEQAAAQQAAAREADARAQASALALTSQVITAPVVYGGARRTTGVSTRAVLEVTVTDLLALVKHIAAHPELIGLLKTDDTKLKAYCRGLGEHANLPGVSVSKTASVAVRTH